MDVFDEFVTRFRDTLKTGDAGQITDLSSWLADGGLAALQNPLIAKLATLTPHYTVPLVMKEPITEVFRVTKDHTVGELRTRIVNHLRKSVFGGAFEADELQLGFAGERDVTWLTNDQTFYTEWERYAFAPVQAQMKEYTLHVNKTEGQPARETSVSWLTTVQDVQERLRELGGHGYWVNIRIHVGKTWPHHLHSIMLYHYHTPIGTVQKDLFPVDVHYEVDDQMYQFAKRTGRTS
ncbi:Hypothetical protein POVN_LOCUS275 [uncultured virus]|nr:Hypothetical protein POVN_LOCUS275 [uncultured virus]